jgi:hypothetical protein
VVVVAVVIGNNLNDEDVHRDDGDVLDCDDMVDDVKKNGDVDWHVDDVVDSTALTTKPLTML